MLATSTSIMWAPMMRCTPYFARLQNIALAEEDRAAMAEMAAMAV